MKSVTAITEVFADGQKVSAVAIEYDREIDYSKLLKSAFAVSGRTITNVYANNAPAKASLGRDGKYVILELSKDNATGAIIADRGGPGSAISRSKLNVSVTQLGDVSTTAGEKYASDTKRSYQNVATRTANR